MANEDGALGERKTCLNGNAVTEIPCLVTYSMKTEIVQITMLSGVLFSDTPSYTNPLNAELNPIRHLLTLVGARHIVHVSRIRVKICRN